MRRSWVLAISLTGFSVSLLGAGEEQAAVKELIGKAVKAAGGLDKLAKLQNVTLKAKSTIEQLAISLEGSFQGPDHVRLDVDVDANGAINNVLVIMTGNKVWLKANDKVNEIKVRDFAPIRDLFFTLRSVQLFPLMQKKGVAFSPLGEVMVGTEPAMGLRLSRKDRPDVRLFFDKKTHLPVKGEVRLTRPGGGREIDLEFLFADFKDFDGLKHCTKIVVRAEGKEFTWELSDLRFQETFDPGLFAKP